MCGIIGTSWAAEQGVREAAATFAYRGPDDFGLFMDGRVTLGHDRLSIVDLDPRSNQPMADEKGGIYIVFNGEIYNHQEIRKALDGKYSFHTTSDTETLLYAYREYGDSLGEYLRGMFSFVIYDAPRHKLVAFRDHAGIKPLYYFYDGEKFAFASELKGIVHALRKEKIELAQDLSAYHAYAAHGYIPSPRTLYRKVQKLERGHMAVFDLESKKIDIKPYKKHSSAVSNVEAFQKQIEDRVLDHLMADVPVGVFFSGGTDSSMIVSILHAHGIDLAAFSVAMQEKKEDQRYFEQVSQHLGVRSHVFSFGPKEFMETYEQVMSRVDDPIADGSIFPTYFISEKASKQVKVVLSGEGGDEYFYGYHRQHVLKGMRWKKSFLGKLVDTCSRYGGGVPWLRKVYAAIGDIAGFYLYDMSPFSGQLSKEACIAGRKTLEALGGKPIDIDKHLYLENDLLRKVDMATSYASIEGRVPLLDVDVCANASTFAEGYVQGGELKGLLKSMLCKYLPKELVYRKKTGFGLDDSFLASPLLEDAKKGWAILQKAGSVIGELHHHQKQVIASAMFYRSLVNLGEVDGMNADTK